MRIYLYFDPDGMNRLDLYSGIVSDRLLVEDMFELGKIYLRRIFAYLFKEGKLSGKFAVCFWTDDRVVEEHLSEHEVVKL